MNKKIFGSVLFAVVATCMSSIASATTVFDSSSSRVSSQFFQSMTLPYEVGWNTGIDFTIESVPASFDGATALSLSTVPYEVGWQEKIRADIAHTRADLDFTTVTEYSDRMIMSAEKGFAFNSTPDVEVLLIQTGMWRTSDTTVAGSLIDTTADSWYLSLKPT